MKIYHANCQTRKSRRAKEVMDYVFLYGSMEQVRPLWDMFDEIEAEPDPKKKRQLSAKQDRQCAEVFESLGGSLR